MIWAGLMFFSMQIDRGNLSQANSDDFLTDIGLNTDGGFVHHETADPGWQTSTSATRSIISAFYLPNSPLSSSASVSDLTDGEQRPRASTDVSGYPCRCVFGPSSDSLSSG